MNLLDLTPQKTIGNIKGRCVLCGRNTENGLKIGFSDNFTMFDALEEGNCLCPNCNEIGRNQIYRRKSWIITKEEIKFVNKEEILKNILNPPEPPFFIHISMTGKKQGFLRLVNKLSFSKEKFYVSFEDEVIFVQRDKFKKYYEFIKLLRGRGISKTELYGNLNVKSFKIVTLSEAEYIKNHFLDPLWSLAVYLS